MKVIVINGSPHLNGCTSRALAEVESVLNAEGIETVRVNVGVKPIRGCTACLYCVKNRRCVFNDDAVNPTAELLAEADGLIVGSPVYYAGINGQVRSFLDRLFYSSSSIDKTMKLGAAVLSSRRAGSTTAYDEIIKYFGITSMPVVTSTYWNEVHGSSAEDVDRDLEGLQTMRNLGHNFAFLLKAIDGRRNLIPKQERTYRTNFIRE